MEVVSIKQAQQIIGIKRTKIYELLNNGEIKAFKCGRRTLISKDELDNFIVNLEAYPTKTGGRDE